MSGDTSDAEAPVPGVVMDTARDRVQSRILGTIAAGLAVALFSQAFLLGILVQRSRVRLYVPESTLITPLSAENAR